MVDLTSPYYAASLGLSPGTATGTGFTGPMNRAVNPLATPGALAGPSANPFGVAPGAVSQGGGAPGGPQVNPSAYQSNLMAAQAASAKDYSDQLQKQVAGNQKIQSPYQGIANALNQGMAGYQRGLSDRLKAMGAAGAHPSQAYQWGQPQQTAAANPLTPATPVPPPIPVTTS